MGYAVEMAFSRHPQHLADDVSGVGLGGMGRDTAGGRQNFSAQSDGVLWAGPGCRSGFPASHVPYLQARQDGRWKAGQRLTSEKDPFSLMTSNNSPPVHNSKRR